MPETPTESAFLASDRAHLTAGIPPTEGSGREPDGDSPQLRSQPLNDLAAACGVGEEQNRWLDAQVTRLREQRIRPCPKVPLRANIAIDGEHSSPAIALALALSH